MNCMKCGREIREDQVFCNICQESMKKYPVKPGTAVQLPQRKDSSGVRKILVKRRAPTPEERIQRLKRRLRYVTILWLVTLLLLAATIYPTVEFFLGKTFHLPGQNYTTITEARSTASGGGILP